MVGFRGPPGTYAGVAGADLENAPAGPVPFTSPFGLPVGRPQTWRPVVNEPGTATGGVPGRIVQRVSGNPSVATSPVAVEQLPYGGVHNGANVWRTRSGPAPGPSGGVSGGGNPDILYQGGRPQFGVPRVLQQGQESAVRAPGNAPVGYSNDKLTTLDRHGMMKVGYENSGRNSGNTDPPMDGPARPSLWLVNRSLSYQQGTDKSAATDDLSRDYTRNAQGMYVGEQGTGWSHVNGGVPGLYQEYGSYEGFSPSSPQGQGIHSPVGQGQAGDGPHDVWGGPPHGLHSPTLPTYQQTLGRYMDIPQMARPRIDRPSQSTIAGQSYSQTVQSQGQTGQSPPSQTMTRSGFNRRARTNGWRGRAAGLCQRLTVAERYSVLSELLLSACLSMRHIRRQVMICVCPKLRVKSR